MKTNKYRNAIIKYFPTILPAMLWMIGFFVIHLPLTMGGIVSGSILVFIPTLGLFFITDLMGGSKVILMSNLIKNQFLTVRDWPFGCAISVILIIFMLSIIIYNSRVSGTKGTKEVL